ncbi:hypothetical protein O2V63_07090 [Modestobacter sp. VKM Ac-2977]|uniref:hypothetical protein n=1 Tax=Modestobacter sp. VKM Ac-2977 TaxID=3004131 RepID=UPI0022AA6A65|nr:hypothetical protein [Modestobacter sp. VKM Ac-2977]MCZ2820086.1 hypothetical protein [Modestobacter sp. VKM Ac-2977]
MAEPPESSSPADQPRWQSGTGLALGMSLGTALGLTVLDNLAVGLSTGVAVGLGLDALQARRR